MTQLQRLEQSRHDIGLSRDLISEIFWLAGEAEAQKVPAYVIFSDATLVAVSDTRPDSRAALGKISGIGSTKLDRYAEPVLAVLSGADPETVDVVEIQ